MVYIFADSHRSNYKPLGSGQTGSRTGRKSHILTVTAPNHRYTKLDNNDAQTSVVPMERFKLTTRYSMHCKIPSSFLTLHDMASSQY